MPKQNLSIPRAVAVLFLVAAAPALAQGPCNLSFNGETCSELPCAPGPYREVSCPFPDSVDPVPGAPPWVCHPYPQPRPETSRQCSRCDAERCETFVNTGEGVLPPSNPFAEATFPGTNLLPTVYTNAYDSNGHEMPNTLPSTPNVPYNLHDGEPVVSEIDRTSPIDDLGAIFTSILQAKVPEVIEHETHKTAEAEGGWTEYDEAERRLRHDALVEDLQSAIDILEGNRVPYRVYSGFPMLHYNSPEKVKEVVPIRDAAGKIVGGNVDVHQIWFDQRIESDTAYIDPSPIATEGGEQIDVPWTITYTVDVLTRGHDDFSPFVMYTDYIPGDAPGNLQKPPNIGMDQSFFNMEEGTRTVFKIKMTYPKYLNLVYTWGWRMHPPRIQVMENGTKKVGFGASPDPVCQSTGYSGLTLPQVEEKVFGQPPMTDCRHRAAVRARACLEQGEDRAACEEETASWREGCRRNQLAAIAKIGDLAPAKRMWNAVRDAQEAAKENDVERVSEIIRYRAWPAYLDWQNRTHLPCFRRNEENGECAEELEPDPESDITILYVNNTIYGELTAGGWVRWPDWKTRYAEWQREEGEYQTALAEWREAMPRWEAGPKTGLPPQHPRPPAGPPILHVTALNGDYFVHGYVIADFGGNRGWENQFKSSVKVAGSGCWFTFGRVHWWLPAGGPNGALCVPPASGEFAPGRHDFQVQFNFEPSRRLRFYQFDPWHHDVAVYSIH